MSKKKKRLFMQKSTPKAGETTTRKVRGYLNEEGNVIRFYLGNGVKLAVYRNAKGDWIAQFDGVQP